MHKWLKGECKDIGAWLFSVVNIDYRQREQIETQAVSSEHQETLGVFTMTTTVHWHGFPREAAASSSMKAPKSHLGVVQNNTQGGPWHCLISDAGQNDLQGPFLLQTFCASVNLSGKRKSLGEVKEDAKDSSLKIDSPRC